ncbi:hypothetical protein B0T18DRAFT_491212 [Schizothecium vesticola]|uniref:Uncharacterized protein n=1 Tax=Schizothecium vesticola TaxID=314040 RepID=A0AA40JZ86_9PEZI|nr:hypothetical protein B0T18DRAFT_491212 [Schizothecium vesticola]
MRRTNSVAPDMAFFDAEHFDDEPICCTASADNDNDILCVGSDDDAYPTAADRLLRYEEQANRFLSGAPRRILSASLQGPFDKESGWTNPWRSQRAPAAPPNPKKKAPKRKCAATTTTRKSRKKKKVVEEPPQEVQAVAPTTVTDDPIVQDLAHTESGAAARYEYLDGDKADRVKEWADSLVVDIEPVASFAGFEEALGAPPRRGPRRKRKNSSRRTSSIIQTNDRDAPSERSSFADVSHIAIGLGTPTPANGFFTSSLSAPPSSGFNVPRISTPQTRALPARQATRMTLELRTPTNADLTLGSHDISLGATNHGGETVAPAEAAHAASRLSPVPAEHDPVFLTCSDRSFRFRAKPQQSKKKGHPILPAEPLQVKPRPKRLLAIADLLNSPAPQRNSNNVASGGQAACAQAENVNKPNSDSMEAKEPTIDPEVVNEPAPGPANVNLPPLHILPITATNLPQIHEFLPPVTLPSIGASISEQPELQPSQEQMVTPRPSSSQQAASKEHVAVGIVEYAPGAEETDRANEPALDVHLSEETEMSPKPMLNPSTQSAASSPSAGSDRLGLGLDLGTFSFEKQQSQTIMTDLASAPRKLLWPKLQRRHASPASLKPPSASFQLPELGFGVGVNVSRAVPSSDDALLPSSSHNTTFAAISPAGSPTAQQRSPQEDIRKYEPEENAASGLASTTTPSSAPNKPLPVLVHSSAREYLPKAPEFTDTDVIFEPVAETEGLELPQAEAGQSSSRSPATTASSPQQSPWSKGNMAPSTPTAAVSAIVQGTGVLVAEQVEGPQVSLPQMVQQSPWARGDSQVTALVKPRPLSPIPSPLSSPRLPEPGNLNPVLPQLRIPEKPTPSDPPNPPTTPDRQTSSLPTPEFTLSIKSFREFMTPSPPKRRPLAPKSSNGRFPSTQVLEDVVVSNPWARLSCTQPPRPTSSSLKTIRKTRTKTKKRVSWGPLPSEPEQQRPSPSAKPTPARRTPTTPALRSRPASPPPSSLVSAEDLPVSEQKFASHFAAVKAARRRLSGIRNGMRRGSSTPTMRNKKNAVRLLPSESQQTCPSPAMGAMAEAFLRADEVLALEGQGAGEGPGVGVEEAVGVAEEEDEEQEQEGEEEDTQKSVDDVSHVLENLDDFLGSWDVETELEKLEKERKESRREKENRKEGDGEEEDGWRTGEGSMSVGLGLGTLGMADELLGRGVWD